MSVDFIDSNVFVCLFDETDPARRSEADRIVGNALATGGGVISFQVVQETINVLSRKLKAPSDDVRRFLDTVLVPLWRVSPSAELYREAIHVHARYGFSFYDAMIVVAARDSGCRRLLSEDLQDGQQIGDLIIVNPFR
jgi:predicted nucleic acid-binding protein